MVALFRRKIKAQDYIVRRNEIKAGIDALSVNNMSLMTGRANTAQSIKDRIAAVIGILDQIVP